MRRQFCVRVPAGLSAEGPVSVKKFQVRRERTALGKDQKMGEVKWF